LDIRKLYLLTRLKNGKRNTLFAAMGETLKRIKQNTWSTVFW